MADAKTLEVVTTEEIRELLQARPGPAISIFHPTERATVDADANSLHLKNLLGDAHDRLEQQGLRRPEIEELLEPLNSILANPPFWHHQLDGIAFFRTPELFRYYKLPYSVDELIAVGHRLHIKPLLRALSESHYYLLGISRHQVRLLRCTRFGVEEVDLEGLGIPRTVDEALAYDDIERPTLQHHPTTGPGQQSPAQNQPPSIRRHGFHGHGQGGDDPKINALRFFHGVDDGISKVLAAENVPLILAGVQEDRSLYREANHYQHLLDKGLDGNPDRLPAEKLHQQSQPLIEPFFREQMDAARDQFGNQIGTGLGTTDLDEALRAARDGRLAAVFIRDREQVWGSFNMDADEITKHDEPQPGDLDLLDQLAGMTLEQAGRVYVVGEAEVPQGGLVAAVYRY